MAVDFVLFFILALMDFVAITAGFPLSLLLFYPVILFLNNRSVTVILTGTLSALFLTEVFHGYMPGSLVFAGGFSIYILHRTVGILNWSILPIQWLGSAGYALLILLARSLFLGVFNGLWILPFDRSWLFTYILFSLVLIFRRFYADPVLPGERVSS